MRKEFSAVIKYFITPCFLLKQRFAREHCISGSQKSFRNLIFIVHLKLMKAMNDDVSTGTWNTVKILFG